MSEWNENVDWYEAATAFKAGAHDVEVRRDIYIAAGETPSIEWKRVVDVFSTDKWWKYRIREKQCTITVTIPRPYLVGALSEGQSVLWAAFHEDAARTAAVAAIRAALEQQP